MNEVELEVFVDETILHRSHNDRHFQRIARLVRTIAINGNSPSTLSDSLPGP
ncbi:MAG: hypothetical protein IT223_07555 [Crocinitomicaceae bacterium]|nr:hypothetical protein [Crocinitomicaceae bacterium]